MPDFDKDEALALLKLLVSTNTVNPPGNEKILAEKMAEAFVREGIDVRVDDVGPDRANLIAHLPGEKHSPVFLITGHIDTVPVGGIQWQHDPFRCDTDGDFVYGRGVADMKGSVAALMYAMFLLKRNGTIPKQDVVFCATCGEERGCVGAKAFVDKGGMREIGAVLVGEPSNADMLVAHKGAIWVRVKFQGKTAHGSMPHLGINAVNMAVKFVMALNAQTFDCKPDKWLGMPTFTVNTLNGGVATNVIPDFAECTIDIRTIPGQTKADVESFIKKALKTVKTEDNDFDAMYEFFLDAPPVACPEGDGILDALDRAAGKHLLRRGVNYYTDASELIGGANLPVVIYGPGDDKQAHQPDEYLSLTRFFDAITVYYNLMSEYRI
ncbi:MAG: M20 family metallopeptidase [Phascolarctobacterium sp.]|nr:M20 family metallopeptidase [Phascolarctobacterium sp.]